jgi:hypothetical protein
MHYSGKDPVLGHSSQSLDIVIFKPLKSLYERQTRMLGLGIIYISKTYQVENE